MKNINKIRERSLMQCLLDDGLITKEQVDSVTEEMQEDNELTVDLVLKNDYVNEHDLSKSLVNNYQLPFLYLEDYAVNMDAVELLEGIFSHENKVLPLDLFGKTIVIATSGNISEVLIDDIEQRTGKEVALFLTTDSSLEKKLESIHPQDEISTEVSNRMDELFGMD